MIVIVIREKLPNDGKYNHSKSELHRFQDQYQTLLSYTDRCLGEADQFKRFWNEVKERDCKHNTGCQCLHHSNTVRVSYIKDRRLPFF